MRWNLKKTFLSRILPTTIVILGLALYILIDFYWHHICPGTECTSEFRNGFARPAKAFSFLMVVVVIPFLFLPKHYFSVWLKWLAAPMVVVTIFLALRGDTSPDANFPVLQYPADIIAFLTWVWLIITLIFIVIHYYRTKQRR